MQNTGEDRLFHTSCFDAHRVEIQRGHMKKQGKSEKIVFNNKLEKMYRDMLENNLKNLNLQNKLTCFSHL